jgi:hypothetical protein
MNCHKKISRTLEICLEPNHFLFLYTHQLQRLLVCKHVTKEKIQLSQLHTVYESNLIHTLTDKNTKIIN